MDEVKLLFFKVNRQAVPALLLMLMTVLAMLFMNTSLRSYYSGLLSSIWSLSINNIGIKKPLLLWINDGLMSIFFLFVGLELKKEFCTGYFVNKRNILLPAFGSLGGILLPATIYIAFNYHDKAALTGWAIPCATDIAFSLGVLALVGHKINPSVRLLLISIAILDDIGSILIIACFYTSDLSLFSLFIALITVFLLYFLLNQKITALFPYLLLGFIMWVAMLKSGVHATLAGVLTSFFIPLDSQDKKSAPLIRLEHALKCPVNYLILPLFAFANAGIPFDRFSVNDLVHHVSLGIVSGLFLGKQVGVMGFLWLATKLEICTKPKEIAFQELYGIALLSGIGFTMSLFIGSLAFEHSGINLLIDERIGILIGSFLSGLAGFTVLKHYQIKHRHH